MPPVIIVNLNIVICSMTKLGFVLIKFLPKVLSL